MRTIVTTNILMAQQDAKLKWQCVGNIVDRTNRCWGSQDRWNADHAIENSALADLQPGEVMSLRELWGFAESKHDRESYGNPYKGVMSRGVSSSAEPHPCIWILNYHQPISIFDGCFNFFFISHAWKREL